MRRGSARRTPIWWMHCSTIWSADISWVIDVPSTRACASGLRLRHSDHAEAIADYAYKSSRASTRSSSAPPSSAASATSHPVAADPVPHGAAFRVCRPDHAWPSSHRGRSCNIPKPELANPAPAGLSARVALHQRSGRQGIRTPNLASLGRRLYHYYWPHPLLIHMSARVCRSTSPRMRP